MVPGVDECDVDVLPEPGGVDRLGVVDCRHDVDGPDLRQRVGATAADPEVVVDDRDAPGRAPAP